jgi:hypothetical protein
MRQMVMTLKQRAGDLICLCDTSHKICGLAIKNIDGNKLDCRMSNLEYVRLIPYKSSGGIISKYRGVTRYNKKWLAKCWMKGKNYHLGLFDKEDDAARAYDNFCLLNHLKNRKLNFQKSSEVRDDYDFLKQMIKTIDLP